MRSLLVLAVTFLALSAFAQPPGAEPEAGDSELPESPLLLEPKTPDELFRAVDLMVKLARPRLARQYLDQLMAAEPSDEVLLELRDKYGPAVFLKFSRIKELQPLSAELLDRVNQAFRDRGASDERIDQLLADLSGNAQQRAVAIVTLRNTGPIVVPRLLEHLADPNQAGRRDQLLSALIQMGDGMIPPLLGALDSPNENLRATVLEALGLMGSTAILQSLWHPAFAPDQPPGVRVAAQRALARLLRMPEERIVRLSSYGVAAELKRAALEHYRGDYNWKVQAGEPVGLWVWSLDDQNVAVRQATPQNASLYMATRLARQALDLAPERRELQTLVLATTLALARAETGWNQPLPGGPGTAYNLALTSGTDVVTGVLDVGIQNGNAATCLAAVEVLGQIGTRHLLSNPKSPLLSALNYPDRRVQFAAASAVMQLDPKKSFSGADRIVSIFTRALNDNGSSAALVVHPRTAAAQDVAGLLEAIEFRQTYTAPTGRAAFRMAANQNDIQLIVLEINTIRWNLSQTVANLRADARTSAIPIVIYGPEEMRPRVDGLIGRYGNMTYVIHSVTPDNLEVQLRPFLNRAQTPRLTDQQRTAHKGAAAYWFAHIANGHRTAVFDIVPAEDTLRAAVNDPQLTSNALVALGAIPTATSQSTLQEIAVAPTYDAGTRETAALQLAFHIQRRGLLISDRQVSELETTWRGETDPRVATALASVVGSLKPNPQRVTGRLKTFPPPSVP